MMLVEVPNGDPIPQYESERNESLVSQIPRGRSRQNRRRKIFTSRDTTVSAPTQTGSNSLLRKPRRLSLLRFNLTLPILALFNLLRSLTNSWTLNIFQSVRSIFVNINVNAQSEVVNVANVTHNVHVVLTTASTDSACSGDCHGNPELDCGVRHETSASNFRETFSRVTVDTTETLEQAEAKFQVSEGGWCDDGGGAVVGNARAAMMGYITMASNTLSLCFHTAGGHVKSLSALLLIVYMFHRAFTYMLLYPLFRLLFGTLYPAYASYKAVKSKNVKEYVKWMMYWIVFALFTCAETITDVFLSWFPFYYEIKIIMVIWLLSPATKGSSFLYRKFVHPMLSSREQEIDEYISKAKEQSYKQVLDIGQKGVNALMQTALKGGGGLVNQIRKSYSLSDLTDSRHNDDAISDIDDVPLRKRSPSKKQRPSGISTSLYFSEIDVRTEGITSMASAEDISSGYSSNETLLQLAAQATPKQREALARGASLKARPTRVTRAGAAAGSVTIAKKSATTDEQVCEDVVFVNGKPERLATIPSLSPSPRTSQSSSDNEFMDTQTNSDEESSVREVVLPFQGKCDVQESVEELKDPVPDTNNSNNQIKDTRDTQLSEVPEALGASSKESEDINEMEVKPSDVPVLEHSKEVFKELVEPNTSIETKKSEDPLESVPSGPRKGKYHKKTAPTPPKSLGRKILDENQVGAITATLVLQPGIIKPLAEGDEVFCHSPKLRRRNKSRSRSKSPSPSPKLYRKLFNKSPNLSKKDLKDQGSPMAKFMGLFKHEEKDKASRSSWHGSTSNIGEKGKSEGH